MKPRSLAALALLIVSLSAAPLRAGVLNHDGIGVYGDSLSWQYSLWVPLAPSFNYSLYSDGFQLNWVDHLVQSGYNFGPQVDATGNHNFYNQYDVAIGGAQTSDLPGQVTSLRPYIASGDVKLTVLGMGGNDFSVGGEYDKIYNFGLSHSTYNPLTDAAVQTFITTMVNRISTAITDTLTTNPHEHMIVVNVPDLGLTPSYRSSHTSVVNRGKVSTVVDALNQRISALAAAHHLPLVDINAFGQVLLNPPTLVGITLSATGGTTGDKMFLSDGFHPGTVAQGLLANAILMADHLGYNDPVALISDQTIVSRANLTPLTPGPAYYDVSPYVTANQVPEPSSLVLAAGGAMALAFVAARRRARRASDV